MKGRYPRHISGVALITALFFGALCLGLATAFLIQVPFDLGATSTLENKTRASYIAEAAVQDTMAWISHTLAKGQEPCTGGDPTPTRRGTLDGWNWTCLVEPDSGTHPNPATQLRIYKLTAIASKDGVQQYRVIADVQAGQSFSRFSIFIDRSGTITYDFVVTKESRVQGPVHKNRPISFLVSPELLAGDPPGDPFDSIVSTTDSNHLWYSEGRSIAPPTYAQYDSIFKHGSSDLQFGVAPRAVPSDSKILAEAAWGGVVPPAPFVGVVTNDLGGLFIGGDVDRLEMKVNPSGFFVLEIEQMGQVTTVTEDTASGKRITRWPSGATSEASGVGTGVIFATGDIRSLKGVNKGPHTIANQFEAGKTIDISGSITRDDTPVGSVPSSNGDRLGIVSSSIFVAKEAVLPRNIANPLRIYATLLATEIFEVRDRDFGNAGAMAIYGGMASAKSWKTVKLNNLTELRVVSGYGGLSGYGSADILYDKRLADEPPPEYPTTGAADLKVRSWREHPL